MMDRPQPLCNLLPTPSTYTDTADAADHGRVSGRFVSPVSGEPLGVNRADFTPVTGQKEIGISSRTIAFDADNCKAAKRKPTLKKPEAIKGTNTAILNRRQVKLIKRLIDDKTGKFTVNQFIDVVSFLYYRPNERLPKDYFKSSTLLSEIIRNQLWDVFEMDASDKIRSLLLSTPERRRQILLTGIKEKGYKFHYDALYEELKDDVDFLTEYSSLNGLPEGTPPKLAETIYERLDIAAKIKSISVLPDSFIDDDLYDELIRSGRIELSKLPLNIRYKNKEYCLLQLSKDRCRLSEIPAHFRTKKAVLDSLNGDNIHDNFIEFCENDYKYKMMRNDPDFFEEVLLKIASATLEIKMELEDSKKNLLSDVYKYCIKRYMNDREKIVYLLEKLVKVNPFFVISVENSDNTFLQKLIGIGKKTLLEMLSSRPEISQFFDTKILSFFFDKVNAGDDFKTEVMNIVFPYFPCDDSSSFPEEILAKQDVLVLNSDPFASGENHIVGRRLRPDKADFIIDYIEHFQFFLSRFDDKEYLEKCCIDPTNRQRLIHILANRVIADKRQFMADWKSCVPRKLIDDTLAYLSNPALFSELDVSGTLTVPVNPLKFQQPNTSAFKLLVSLHANGLQIADKDASRLLQSEFDRAERTNFKLVYRGQYQHSLSLFKGKGVIVGGRTLAMRNGKTVDYYKFQRLGESVATLAQEGIMHQFIAGVLNKRFKSQLPRFGQYLIVLEKDLPESIRGFTDRLQVINVNGERAFRVYHFKATKNYAKYAHTPDGTSTPYVIAERGLLNGIHDIGVLNDRLGVMPTSTIPVFHDTGRRWVFLSPLLGNSIGFALPLPGTFGGWVKAIERPDFGWDGLRDWGDVEFFGAMKSGLTARDSKTSGYTPEVMQRLSFANALCENLLAAVLLRSRLRRDSPDYHYQNQQAVEETENFIEQLLDAYLSGLLAKEKEWPPRPRLQELMGLDDTTYCSWLKRTAEEILYWTARQPSEATDPGALDPSVECFSKHIKETGNLDATLYPKGLSTFDKHKKFPRDFHNVNDQLNLGANNAVFPLVALAKGLTLLVAYIFAFANRYAEDENRE
ncbi:hypothetical protein [Endozoicomonas sp. 8E]|uniref:hypothetical protein n=1 Tax=Endozoicomonas sp. 8E TaxID=3035692 RepID=UPI002938F46A|nr:hypothetical protein [Endozoicomonas sp. 8E]WOG26499.1 hypothetical protein P6910_18395 [Endozoicomonas sp. 8E]